MAKQLSANHQLATKKSSSNKNAETWHQKSESNSKWTCWLNSFGLKCRDDLPLNCRESFIQHGYRPNPSSYAYCMLSAFHPTNETGNIWTHAVPFLFMIYHYLSFIDSHLTDLTDPLLYPYWFYVTGVMFTYLGSVCAHTFNCLSSGMYEVCFCCDYGMISLYSIGAASCFTFYLCPYACMISIPGVTLVAYLLLITSTILSLLVSCLLRYPSMSHQYIMRVVPFIVTASILHTPCFYKYAISYSEVNSSSNSMTTEFPASTCALATSPTARKYFYLMVSLFLSAAIIQGYKIPERWFPGKFDIIGHSHQIMHLLVAAAMYIKSIFIENTIKEILLVQNTGKFQVRDLEITWFTGFVIPGLTALVACVVVLYYSVDLHKTYSKFNLKNE